MRVTSGPFLTTVLTMAITAALHQSAAAQQTAARQVAPWLDVPAAWSRTLDRERLLVVPDGLPTGASLRFWVVPPMISAEPLEAAWQRTADEIGPWTPVEPARNQGFETGWLFRIGTVVVEAEGRRFTAVVAVARKNDLLARFWALANSDDTYNRHAAALMTGISSVQDADLVPIPATPAPDTPTARGAAPSTAAGVDPAYGTGLTGAYVGLERGARASAGAGGQQLVLDLATNYLSIGNAPGAPQVQTSVQDYPEVDVFLPDGSYRRGLPVRGLAADLAWDRAQMPVAWGSWRLDGNRITIRRGTWTTSYTVSGDRLVSERDRPWRKLPQLADVRIDGVFARADYHEPRAPRLVLRADGTYEDRGNFLHMVGSALNLVVPDGSAGVKRWSEAEAGRAMGAGSGTYTLDRYTLTFRDRDGRVWQFNAYVPPTEALPATRYLVINGYALVRD